MAKAYIPFGFAQFGYAIFSNTIPILVIIAFGLGAGEVGLLNMICSAFSMLGLVYWARWIDKHEGRQVLAIVGFLMVSVAGLLAIFSNSIAPLLLASALLGFFFSIFGLLGTTLVAQQEHKKYKENLKKYNIVVSASTLTALAFASIFLQNVSSATGLRLLLLFAFASFCLGLSFATYIPKSAPHKPRLSKFQLIKVNIGIFERLHYLPSRLSPSIRFAGIDKRIYFLSFGFSLMLFGFSAFYTALPVFLLKKGISSHEIFLIHLSSAFACTLGYLYVSNIPSKKLLKASTIGRVFIISSFLPLALTSGVTMLIATLVLNALMGICWAGISSASVRIVMRYAGNWHMGNAMGVYHLSLASGNALGALIGGILFASCTAFAYPIFALISLMGFLIALQWVKSS